VAIEVDPANVALLRKNCAAYPNVTVVAAALWSEPGTVRITNPADEPWAFRVEASAADAPDALPATDVGGVLRASASDRIDLLKLDIEGSEIEVLTRGDREWLRRTRLIAVELHDRIRPGCSDALAVATGVPMDAWGRSGEYVVVNPRPTDGAAPGPQ
jgi:FkbM family methyltransferase